MKLTVGPYTIEIKREQTILLDESIWNIAAFEHVNWMDAATDQSNKIAQQLQAGETIMCPFCNVPLTHAPAIIHTCMACIHGHCELVGTSHT